MRLILNAIRKANRNTTAVVEFDWISSDDTVVWPNVIAVSRESPDPHLEQAPNVVTELHAGSIRKNERVHKRKFYQQQGVDGYLIVGPQGR